MFWHESAIVSFDTLWHILDYIVCWLRISDDNNFAHNRLPVYYDLRKTKTEIDVWMPLIENEEACGDSNCDRESKGPRSRDQKIKKLLAWYVDRKVIINTSILAQYKTMYIQLFSLTQGFIIRKTNQQTWIDALRLKYGYAN